MYKHVYVLCGCVCALCVVCAHVCVWYGLCIRVFVRVDVDVPIRISRIRDKPSTPELPLQPSPAPLHSQRKPSQLMPPAATFQPLGFQRPGSECSRRRGEIACVEVGRDIPVFPAGLLGSATL